MKKQSKIIVIYIVIITALLGGAFVYFVKGQREAFVLAKESFAIKFEEADINRINRVFRIKSVILLDGEYVVLDQNGTVWKWKEGETKEDAVAITGMEDIVQITATGYDSIYALTSGGDVYAWGINAGFLINPEEDTNVEFPEPVKLKGLSNIVSIDAGSGQAYAVNDSGQLFVWGLGRYKSEKEDYIPSLLEGPQKLTDNVEEIYPGTGNFHYFRSKDNQFFSIMSAEYYRDYLAYVIVPNFPGEPTMFNWRDDIYAGKNERIFDIRKTGGFYLTYLYEMGKNDNIALLAADDYTIYMYEKDGALLYWNSGRITYHDCERAGASLELQDLDYSGFFEEVDISSVMNTGILVPDIISISPSKEGALFLMEDGSVFTSGYVTTEVKDVEHFDSRNPKPNISERTVVEPQLSLKELSFQRLEFENIVSISSDKNDIFYLVDKYGNIYSYQISLE